MQAGQRIIVALDVSETRQALGLVDRLKDKVGFFKVGLQLFTAEGPTIVSRIKERGAGVFLDLKIHDIPNTAASAALEAVRHGADMVTLHAAGGQMMMWEAAERVRRFWEQGATEGPPPLLLGVTVLTSLDQAALKAVGVDRPLGDQVLRLARLAARSGLKGVVCSPQELAAIKGAALDLKLVTPGIRPQGGEYHDQARVLTPRQAVQFGADYLVIGRPITGADDPVEAVEKIVAEIE